MAKYIDADEMLANESEAYLYAQSKITDKVTRDINYVVHTKLQKLLADTPAADVQEVRHGRWIIEDKYTDYRTERCSACGFAANRAYVQDIWRYCPNCGASMMDDNATQHTECVENALGALAELENGIYGVRDGQVYKMRCATPEELFPNAKKVKINLMAVTEEEE